MGKTSHPYYYSCVACNVCSYARMHATSKSRCTHTQAHGDMEHIFKMWLVCK